MARKLSGEKKRLAVLAKKTVEQKLAVCEHLAKCCIVQLACERAGVGRSTYYKWRGEDIEFKTIADKAITAGRAYLNDIAFSALLKKLQEGHMTSIIFFLKNNHEWFSEKIWHKHMHEHKYPSADRQLIGDGILHPEQREQITRALEVSGRAESIRRHELLSKIFSAEVDPDSSKEDLGEDDASPSVAPPSKPKNPPPKLPSTGMKKPLNIADFLKRTESK